MGLNLNLYKKYFQKIDNAEISERKQWREIFKSEIIKDLKKHCNVYVEDIELKTRDWSFTAYGFENRHDNKDHNVKIKVNIYFDYARIFINGFQLDIKYN